MQLVNPHETRSLRIEISVVHISVSEEHVEWIGGQAIIEGAKHIMESN